jgi:hypothetical protein
MKMTVQLSKESLSEIYYEHKEYAMPIASILVALFLFLTFLLPQILSFPAKKTEIDIENQKLDAIKEAEAVITSTNKSTLDSQLQIASKTLPPSKLFDEVLRSISSAAALSGTQLESYEYQDSGGELPEGAQFPSMSFEVSLIGDVNQAIRFIEEIYKSYPISDVKKITYSGGTANLSINFYYKAFPTADIVETTEIKNTSEKGRQALAEISRWTEPQFGDLFTQLATEENNSEVSSESAEESGSF